MGKVLGHQRFVNWCNLIVSFTVVRNVFTKFSSMSLTKMQNLGVHISYNKKLQDDKNFCD